MRAHVLYRGSSGVFMHIQEFYISVLFEDLL